MNEMVAYSNRLTRILYTAAAFSLVLGIFAAYFYQKATSQSLYSANYHSYQTHTTRSNEEGSALKASYEEGRMDSVLAVFQASRTHQAEDYLLAGIAFLEKGQSENAIQTFREMIRVNRDSKSDFFEADAEYYLAMSYLKNNEPGKAMPIFTAIRADAENPYHAVVNDWFMMMMKLCVARN